MALGCSTSWSHSRSNDCFRSRSARKTAKKPRAALAARRPPLARVVFRKLRASDGKFASPSKSFTPPR
eukprot:4944937-Prymnesium_polylepis.1